MICHCCVGTCRGDCSSQSRHSLSRDISDSMESDPASSGAEPVIAEPSSHAKASCLRSGATDITLVTNHCEYSACCSGSASSPSGATDGPAPGLACISRIINLAMF